ncbi:glycosyltransferase family 4 protein [Candidatus Micrarchaeota archaeon]|nr:glycosyltransferase family 4 protein [Candidatus Micrarchaeota archaeon]
MATAFVCICGPYRAEQPRVSKLAATLARKMPVQFVVTTGSGHDVHAVGGKSKASYILHAARYLRRHAHAGDVVLGYGHGGALAAYAGTRGTGASFWYDYPDPWSGWYHYRQPTDSPKWAVGRGLFAQVERRLYRDADLVTTASFGQMDFLRRQHGKRSDAHVILNCPDAAQFRRVPSPSLPGVPENGRVLMYLGSILAEYGCMTLIRMMPDILRRQPSAYLVFLGSAKDPAFLESLKAEAGRLGVSEHVVFLPPVDRNAVPAILSAAEIGFVPFHDVFYNRVGSPNKLFEYMACGAVPVVSDMDEFHHYLRPGSNALFVPPQDASAFANATVELLSEPKRLQGMRTANAELVRTRYNWSVQEEQLLGALACLPSS